MKRFVIILLAVCLILGGVVGYLVSKYDPQSVAAPAPAAETAPDAETASEGTAELRAIDYDALYASRQPGEIVGSVCGRGVTWDEFFYWLHNEGIEMEQTLQAYASYGMVYAWDDLYGSDSDLTIAQYVVELAKNDARKLNFIEAVAAEYGAALTEENEAEIEEYQRSLIEYYFGAEDGEAQFDAYLEQEHFSRAVYDRVNRMDYLTENLFAGLYGERGEKLAEDELMAQLTEGGYLYAAHILFLTIDETTKEPLDDETAAQKLAQAEEVSAELRAIDDPDERAARFAELKAQYCEDTAGTANYPEGYLYAGDAGIMDKDFTAGVKALAEYEVSEPIKSAYGYHVILRLPLRTDVKMYGVGGSAREFYANERFNDMMNERWEKSLFEPAEGFELDLTQYLK